ncbi:sensor domain-containing protein [Ideonella sp.]|uniref:sensor domain-containing protein n=1 Tax=Ideonella sp. TaxID=1929293 RepID=UPI002B495B61|nr:EAL domain-containing protein [Ideonella sp.]HJV71721.1 EAL domain-containing protein [Ideonella sp.]
MPHRAASPVANPSRASSSAWLRGLLALVVVVLGLAAWAFVAATESLARAGAGDAEALNLAGRQAYLAERLAAAAANAGSGADSTLPLADALARMLEDAVRLYELRGVWSGNEDSPEHWTAHRERLWAAAQSLQMARERGETKLDTYTMRVQTQAQQFVAAMEQATGELQRLAEARQRGTRRAHAVLVGLLAAGVSVLLWGLGEPLARRIRRHQTQLEAQAQQLERLAMVADRTQNGVVIADARGLLVWANQGFTRITGFTADEVRGRKPASFLQFEGTDPGTSRALDQALAAAEPVRVEILNRSKQGRSFWVDLDIQPLRDAAGVLTGFIQVTTDITAQVERREYLDAILRALPAGLLVQDAQGRIVDANLKAEQLMGLPRSELIGRTSFDPRWAPVGEDGTPMRPEAMPSIVTLRSGQPQVDRPVGVRTPDGQRRWLRVNTQILAGPDGSTQGVISCFLDETDLREQGHLLRMTIDGAGVGTWDWEVGTDALHYNEGWAAMLGYGPGDLRPQVDAFQALLHPDDVSTMRETMRRHLKDPAQPYRTEYRLRRQSGDWIWVLAAGAVIERTADGRAKRMAGVHLDITARKALEQALGEAASTDALTQLPNRAGIQRDLARCVARVHEQPGHRFAVLFMDFDRFKLVNDSLGHEAGDELLRQIAARVKQTLRPGDDVAPLAELGAAAPGCDVAGRLGGDEFIVLLHHINHPADAIGVAQRLLDALAAPYQLAGRSVQSSASIGIVTSDISSGSVESVLRDADTAMYEAKRRGRGRYVVFDPEMHHRIRHAMDLEADLRQALQRPQQDGVFVVYQPIVALGSRRPIGLEALARWQHPWRGPVSPAEFVPLAEEAGLVDALGELVLRRACLDLAAWQRMLGPDAPRTVAVNLSRAQLRPGQLAATVRAALAEAGLPPAALRLEITETLAMQGEAALTVLGELRAMGISLALDDFGTGYSSLASLDQLPIDTVKIDRAFVAKMVHNRYQTALVKSTVQVADALALKVIAEGVETEAQAAALAALGCHAAQGWLFGRAMAAGEFVAWWDRQARRSGERDAALA